MAAGKKTPKRRSERRTPPDAAPPPDPPSAGTATGQAPTRPRPFLIVGVGGSAGALAALQDLFAHVPADCGMAFIVVSHADPTVPSLLPEILARATEVPVHPATDGTLVEPNNIYVAPPSHLLTIRQGTLRIDQPIKRAQPPLPIDFFFRSLASDQKAQAVGIVLSGTGADGTLGLGTIREADGLAVAQDPATAEFASMPSTAIATGVVDLVLPPGDVPDRLLKYAAGGGAEREPGRVTAPAESDALERIISLVATRTGRNFSSYKRGTLHRRVERRLALHQLQGPDEYFRYLMQTPDEVDALWRDWLIGVSHFFRDPAAFDAVAQAVRALLEAKEDGSDLRVWVPGCATGEEAYSIAILALDTMERMNKHVGLHIFGTDIDAAAIDAARGGHYPEGIAADVDPAHLRRFFVRADHRYQVCREVRDDIVFATQDLLHDPPFTKMDLISCRNVLIYLEAAAQLQLIQLFHYSLRPGGLLFLGASESITDCENLFTPVDNRWKLFRRQPGAVIPVRPAAVRRRTAAITTRAHRPTAATEPGAVPDASALLRRQLANWYGPPTVIVDERGQIEHIHGRTGAYLEPAPGNANLNILEMARPGLRAPLVTALREVTRTDTPAVKKTARVKTNGATVPVHLAVRRVTDPRLARPLVLISFEPIERVADTAATPTEPATGKVSPSLVAELEQEIRTTRNDLQSTIEELQASNEELASANEEVQSVNEELQSTNEELQTSKEETQSLNEELQTVNAELSAKVENMERTHDDLVNLVSAADVAIVFLDEHMHVKWFTPQARNVFRLIETDIGRPLADLSTSLDYPGLIDDAESVLRTLEITEAEIRAIDDAWYRVQIRPYRSTRNAVLGLVLTCTDVTRPVAAELLAQAEARAFESIVDTVREPLLVLDPDLRITRANRAFYATFGVTTAETEHQLIYDVGNGQWDIPDLRRLLEQLLRANESFEDFQVRHTFPGLGDRRMLLNARRIQNEGAPERILLAIEDVTDRIGEPGPSKGPTRA